MTEFGIQIPTGSAIDLGPNRERLTVQVLIVLVSILGGAVVGLATSHYTIGREIAELRGQVSQLVKVEEHVAANRAAIEILDYRLSELSPGPSRGGWRPE